MLETLMTFSTPDKDLIKSSTPKHLRPSRSCCQHLAGAIAVKIHAVMIQEKWLTGDNHYTLTDVGQNELKKIGLNLECINLSQNKLAYCCLDWSERVPHLGGLLAQKLFKLFEQKNWIQRYPQTREVIWTKDGQRALKQYFEIDYASLYGERDGQSVSLKLS